MSDPLRTLCDAARESAVQMQVTHPHFGLPERVYELCNAVERHLHVHDALTARVAELEGLYTEESAEHGQALAKTAVIAQRLLQAEQRLQRIVEAGKAYLAAKREVEVMGVASEYIPPSPEECFYRQELVRTTWDAFAREVES